MLEKIVDIAKKLSLSEDQIENYGNFKAKINNVKANPKGKLILVTAMNPTKYGEGKTTISIGLGDGLSMLNKKVCLALREPSLGPVFGVKGGATGGGKAKIEPSDDINLHFTGDFHAITSANNLLCAMIDNHIFQGNSLDIDTENIYFKRCMDMNDRVLRNITIGQEKLSSSIKRQEGFDITAASEIMEILCLATDLDDLKRRCGNIIVGLNKKGNFVYAKDLKAENAMTILLKDAIKPNLVQTFEGTPAIVHGGPFANIAHGCNSVVATLTALTLGDYVVTEAGFGADLGAEKFLDLKCRNYNLNPAVVVIVATIKALLLHGDGNIEKGFENLKKHIENIKLVYGKEAIVALNKFSQDNEKDIQTLKNLCEKTGVKCIVCDAFSQGGKGCLNLAEEVCLLCEKEPSKLRFAYSLDETIKDKTLSLAQKIYGAKNVEFSEKALKKIENIEKIAKNMPIIIAKTQYSLSDNPNLLGAPSDFTLKINDVEFKSGAEFIVLIAGKISLMPGLPKEPNAVNMKIENGQIYNLH